MKNEDRNTHKKLREKKADQLLSATVQQEVLISFLLLICEFEVGVLYECGDLRTSNLLIRTQP